MCAPDSDWTPEDQAGLVLAILRQDMTVEEAARVAGLPEPMVLGWCQTFLDAAYTALEDDPPDHRETWLDG